jgi:hypothetical protein
MADDTYDTSDGQAPQLTGKQAVVKDIADIFKQKGLSDSGIRGILANIDDESKFDPTLRQPDQPRWGGEAHYAHGLYQEGGGEWNNYAAWLSKNHADKDWRDHRLQTEFMAENLQNRYPHVWDAMQRGTPEQAANAFLSGYLKPREDYRLSRSAKYSQGIPDVDYYLSNVKGNYRAPSSSSAIPESEYLPNSEVKKAFAGYAPTPSQSSPQPERNSFGKYLVESARSAARAPSDVARYYQDLTPRTENPGPYNTLVGGPNAFWDAAIKMVTRGEYGLPDAFDAVGLPSSRTRDSIQAFHNAYAPAIQTASDVGHAALGAGGVEIPEGGSAAASRGAQTIGNAIDTGATAFENAAKNAGNPNQLNVFAPINPTDPRFAQAAKLRGVNQRNPGMSAADVYKNANGAFFEPSGRILENIPDIVATTTKDTSKLIPGYNSVLGEVLDHPELYAKFPGLKNVPVKFVSGANSYSRYPRAIVGDGGDVTIALPKELGKNPDIMQDKGMQKSLKEQLIKAAQYNVERVDPLRSQSFRDKPRVEEGALSQLIDRVDSLAQREPQTPDNVSTTPMKAYSQYLHDFEDKIEEARNLSDDPEAFVQHPIVASGQYGKTLKAQLELKKENGQDLRLKPKQVDEAIASGIHQLSAGTQGAQYATRNVNTGAPYPMPYSGRAFPDSLVRFRPDIADKDLNAAVNNWYNYGNAREYQNKRGPYNKAEGGPVYMNPSMDDYNDRLNARNGLNIIIATEPPKYRKGGKVSKVKPYIPHNDLSSGSAAGQYGVLPPNPYGVQTAAEGGEVTGSPNGDASISPDGMVQDPSGSSPTADVVDANVPEGSHVIPYDALLKLGDGDPERGKNRLLGMIKQMMENEQQENDSGGPSAGASTPGTVAAESGMKSGGKVQAAPKKVPVRVSNKELILSPKHVSAIGRGNMEKGHHNLNVMRMKLRGAK